MARTWLPYHAEGDMRTFTSFYDPSISANCVDWLDRNNNHI